jgi:hypothetical protein
MDDHEVVRRGVRDSQASAGSPLPVAATAITQPGFLHGLPWRGQLNDQLAQGTTRDTRADTMRQGRAGPC